MRLHPSIITITAIIITIVTTITITITIATVKPLTIGSSANTIM